MCEASPTPPVLPGRILCIKAAIKAQMLHQPGIVFSGLPNLDNGEQIAVNAGAGCHTLQQGPADLQ